MTDKKELGRKGEEIAAAFLQALGYRILARNWFFGKEEIDIIAAHGEFVVIVEVKTRTSDMCAAPEASVTRAKQRILVRAAHAFVMQRKLPGEVRFDIVAVLVKPEGESVRHIPDAFYATL